MGCSWFRLRPVGPMRRGHDQRSSTWVRVVNRGQVASARHIVGTHASCQSDTHAGSWGQRKITLGTRIHDVHLQKEWLAWILRIAFSNKLQSNVRKQISNVPVMFTRCAAASQYHTWIQCWLAQAVLLKGVTGSNVRCSYQR